MISATIEVSNQMNIRFCTEVVMRIYGYTRISNPKMSIERQIRNIQKEYPEAIILQDKCTGTNFTRPSWDKLMKRIQKGDTIVFDSVSRMSREYEEGYCEYERLYNFGVNLIFIKEPQINTHTYKDAINKSIPMTGTKVDYILEGINKYLLELAKEQIRLAFLQSEKEVSDLHQRTKEGIETARLNGKQIGQRAGAKLPTKKSISAKEIIKTHSIDFGGTLNDVECIKLAGISKNSFYKYKMELRNGIQ